MEEIAWAAAAAVVALVPPVRRRFLPVSKALLSAGLGVGAAALRGVEGVILAAACGDRSAGGTASGRSASDRSTAADGRRAGSPAPAAAPKRARAATTKSA